MTTLIEAARQALEALEYYDSDEDEATTASGAILILRTTIEAAEKQEPSYSDVQLAEQIMSDCGCSTNNERLLERITARLAKHKTPAAPVQYPLSDDMYDSKDWRDADYAGRVEWLHTMYESSKKTLEAYTAAPVQEPVATLIDHFAFTDGIVRFDGVENMEQLPIGTKFYTIPPNVATPLSAPVQEGRDWSLLEATQESLREHMAEIKRLKEAQRPVAKPH